MLVTSVGYARSSLFQFNLRRVPTNCFVANGMHFGQTTSVPQGYNDPARSLTPTIKTGGQIAARAQGEAAVAADLKATGNIAGLMDAEADLVGNANVYFNGSGTFDAEADMTAALGATGNITATMDLLARPSAFDIAQEVWNGAATAYDSAGTMGRKVNAAEKAARLAAALSA
jgi:hypothetical protein